MSDDEFLTAFEDCSLSREHWNHRAHIRLAYLYCSRYQYGEALERTTAAIRAYNIAKPNNTGRVYHQTITEAFVRLVYDAQAGSVQFCNAEAFCRAHPELCESRVLLRHYSPDRLYSEQAILEFLPPDRVPLPLPADIT